MQKDMYAPLSSLLQMGVPPGMDQQRWIRDLLDQLQFPQLVDSLTKEKLPGGAASFPTGEQMRWG